MQRKKSYVKKSAVLLCALCLLIGVLTGCVTQAEKHEDGELPVIVVGCDDYTPFSYLDANGNMTGSDVELAEEAFRRMGYRAQCTIISWEEKKSLLENGTIDCVWSSFTMDGRGEEYQWAGPYMKSHQVVAVDVDSDIRTLQDLENKVIAVQSTTKPEDIIKSHNGTLPELEKVISVQKRDLIFLLLSKGYVDAIAAHDTAIEQFMSECGLEFQILDEPLLTVGLGVAFDKNDPRKLNEQLDAVLREMYADGTTQKIIGRYFSDTDRYLGGLYEN